MCSLNNFLISIKVMSYSMKPHRNWSFQFDNLSGSTMVVIIATIW